MKTFVWIGVAVGSTIGSFLPMLWGGSAFSMSSVLLSGVGGALGVWGGYTTGKYMGL